VLLKHLAFCVITQGSDVDEAAQVELLRAEHRHAGQLGRAMRIAAGLEMLRSGKAGVEADFWYCRRKPGLPPLTAGDGGVTWFKIDREKPLN
jgi:hypothetical protein